jgi:hypothetical protein
MLLRKAGTCHLKRVIGRILFSIFLIKRQLKIVKTASAYSKITVLIFRLVKKYSSRGIVLLKEPVRTDLNRHVKGLVIEESLITT